MRIPLTALAVIPAALAGLPTAVAAEYTYLSAAEYRGGRGDTAYGLATGVVVCEPKPLRPLAMFGAYKPADGKGQFLYLLVFKTAPDFDARSAGISQDGRGSSETGAAGTAEARLGKKKVEVAYKFPTDPKTHAVTKPSLTVGGKEVKDDDPRVFVVDLTGEAVTYTPVKVELPKEAPDVSAAKGDAWGAAVRRAVEQLKKDSPELTRLLEPGAK